MERDTAVMAHGLVSETKPGFVRVKLPDYDDIVTDWLPVVKLRAMGDDENWPLEVNELVACLLLVNEDSRGDYGWCIGALSNDEDLPDQDASNSKWRKKFKDGTSVEYDKGNHVFTYDLPNSGAKWRVKKGSTLFEVGDKFKMENAATSTKQILTDIITQIKLITVSTGTGPSSVPINATAFDPIVTKINNLFE